MRNWSFMQWVVAVILICAAIAIMIVVIPAMGIVIPSWVMQVIWILIIAFVAVAAIGILVKLWSGWGGPPCP